jgi:hypothetical protein
MQQHYGYAYLELPQHITQQLDSFYQSIPNEYKVDNQGREFKKNKKPIQNFHSTFISKLLYSNKELVINELQQYLKQVKPVRVSLEPMFFEHVKRITTRSVYCVGSGIVSLDGNLRNLREECAEKANGQVLYNGDGHVSICYIKEEYVDQFKQWLKDDHPVTFENQEFQVNTIVVSYGNDKTRISLQ